MHLVLIDTSKSEELGYRAPGGKGRKRDQGPDLDLVIIRVSISETRR